MAESRSAKRGTTPLARCASRLGLLALCVVVILPLASAHAGGSATDKRAPNPWLKPPTLPSATKCHFGRILLSPWKKLGAGTASHKKSPGVGMSGCFVFPDAESYSNAAVLASEIWAYTWSSDGVRCQFDEAATVNSQGIGTELVRYVASPEEDCMASIQATLKQQFSWRIEGKGHIEVEVGGLMHCSGSDLKFPQTTVSGGKAAFVGARAGNAPRPPQMSIEIGTPPFVIKIPFGVGGTPFLAPDEGVVGQAMPGLAPPILLTPVGETLTLRGYAKSRSYADEVGVFGGCADVQGFLYKSDPALEVKLMCGGLVACNAQTTSVYKK